MIAVGVDIGGTTTKVGFVNEKGEIEHRFVYSHNSDNGVEYIQELAKEIKEFADKTYKKEEIVGIGIGAPGAINSRTGVCDYSNNLNWYDIHIVDIMERVTGYKAKISNDANVACLGEAKFGCGKKYHNMVLITIGTGLGGGLYINDQLYEGNDGKGAELGHATLQIKGGRKCTCGKRGCIEAYCSGTALINDTKKAMKKDKKSKLWDMVDGDINKVTGKTAFDAEKLGDKTAHKVITDFIWYLSETIMNYCNIFRPDAVAISGGVCRQGKNLTNRIIENCEKWYYGFQRTPKVDIVIAELGPDTGMIGAAALVM